MNSKHIYWWFKGLNTHFCKNKEISLYHSGTEFSDSGQSQPCCFVIDGTCVKVKYGQNQTEYHQIGWTLTDLAMYRSNFLKIWQICILTKI